MPTHMARPMPTDAFRYHGGRLVLVEPDALNDADWTFLTGVLRRLGYAGESAMAVKNRLTAMARESQGQGRPGFPFQPDQQEAIKKTFNFHTAENYEDRVRKHEQENALLARVQKKALRVFGTTDDFGLAGYIAPDGSLLNFSHEGRQRDIDHREVGDLFQAGDYPEDEPGNNRNAMLRLLSLGFIRIGTASADLMAYPTDEQKKMLARLVNAYQGQQIAVSYTAPSGCEAASRLYPPFTPASEILADVESFTAYGLFADEVPDECGPRDEDDDPVTADEEYEPVPVQELIREVQDLPAPHIPDDLDKLADAALADMPATTRPVKKHGYFVNQIIYLTPEGNNTRIYRSRELPLKAVITSVKRKYFYAKMESGGKELKFDLATGVHAANPDDNASWKLWLSKDSYLFEHERTEKLRALKEILRRHDIEEKIGLGAVRAIYDALDEAGLVKDRIPDTVPTGG